MKQVQSDLFSPQPGFKRQRTSQEAAAGMAPKAPLLRQRVLDAIRRKPGTPEQIALRISEPLMNVRPRCSELLKKGLIKDSGGREQAIGGRRAIVWMEAPQ